MIVTGAHKHASMRCASPQARGPVLGGEHVAYPGRGEAPGDADAGEQCAKVIVSGFVSVLVLACKEVQR